MRLPFCVAVLLPILALFMFAETGNCQKPNTNDTAPTEINVKYGPDPRNILDFWKAKSKDPAPVLVSIHGGGFRKGNKSVPSELLRQCLEEGISVVAITYRFSDTAIAPAQFHDCARAIQFMRSKAADWNLDPNRIASSGGSAGAGLSLWLGFHDDLADPKSDDPVLRQSTRLRCMAVTQAQCSYDPRFIRNLFPGTDVYNHPALAQLFGVDLNKLDQLPEEKYKLFEEVSPINHLTKDDPPALLTYNSDFDAEVKTRSIGIHHPKFGIALKEKMDELKIPCEVVANGKRLGGGEPMTTIQFLKKYLVGTK
jgi:acetyl esterase/lipase